jgi:hypothetical protein
VGLGYTLKATTTNTAATALIVGSSTSSTSDTLALNTTSTPSSALGGGLSFGAITGITVGGFVVAILALLGAWVLVKIGWEQLK